MHVKRPVQGQMVQVLPVQQVFSSKIQIHLLLLKCNASTQTKPQQEVGRRNFFQKDYFMLSKIERSGQTEIRLRQSGQSGKLEIDFLSQLIGGDEGQMTIIGFSPGHFAE